MKSIVISIIFALLLTGCSAFFEKKNEVKINEQLFLCEIAMNDSQRERGLMFREKLEKNTGMIFDLKQAKITGFWMKNTLIPLDILWIDDDKNIISISHAQPCKKDPCEIFTPPSPARWVLEINEGEFLGNIGDKVEFDS